MTVDKVVEAHRSLAETFRILVARAKQMAELLFRSGLVLGASDACRCRKSAYVSAINGTRRLTPDMLKAFQTAVRGEDKVRRSWSWERVIPRVCVSRRHDMIPSEISAWPFKPQTASVSMPEQCRARGRLIELVVVRALLQKLADQGDLERKIGQGFYDSSFEL